MWSLNIILLLLSLYSTDALRTSGRNCIVPFGSRTDWDVFWPLIFNEKGELHTTTKLDDVNSVVIPTGETVIVSCGPNYIKKSSSKEYVRAQCDVNGKLQAESDLTATKVKDFACDLRSIEEVITDVQGCPNDLRGVKFGFVNPIDSKAFITGEACYCTTKGKTLFAHIRKGDSLNSALQFEKNTFFKQRHPDSRYKIEFMKAFRLDEFNDRLREKLNKRTVPEFDMTNYVDDLLLSNKQLYSTRKLAWNYFVLHSGLINFDLLKHDIADLSGNIDIYIGSHGVTTLKNANDERVEIYLDEERFPVPEIVWIVVKSNNKAVGFAVFNDPTITESELEKKSFCVNKCDQISWLKRLGKQKQYLNVRDGAVICCEINDFRKTIDEMPELTNVSQLFV